MSVSDIQFMNNVSIRNRAQFSEALRSVDGDPTRTSGVIQTNNMVISSEQLGFQAVGDNIQANVKNAQSLKIQV